MDVLHYQWVLGQTPKEKTGLFVWGESSDREQPTRDGRKKSAQLHNFQTPPLDLLAQLSISHQSQTAQIITRTLQIPTNKFGPVPSPELVHNWESDPKPPRWQSWEVSGIFLPVADAFEHLARLVNSAEAMESKGPIRLGSDGRYWQHVFLFALNLLVRQQVRPALIQIPNGAAYQYEARWQPLIDGEADGARTGQLVAAMPPVCRAMTEDLSDTLPPRLLVENFLNHMVDHAARSWPLEREMFLPTQSDPASTWVRALFGKEADVQASVGQMQHFHSSFRAWERTLKVAGNKQYRVAFRLESPKSSKKNRPSPKKGWQLHYLLQARDDAAALLPAAEVWQEKSAVIEALDRRFDRPQERLLTGLGYAGRFFEPIKASLNKPKPSKINLTTDEAYAFLRQCAPQLAQSGFGLLTPPWWNKPGTRLGVRLKLGGQKKMKGNGADVSRNLVGFDNLIDYKWELSIGEETLTADEFDALVALKSPLVQIRGQWVQLDAEQIEAAIRFWQQQDALEGTMSLIDGMRLGLVESGEHNGLPLEGVELDDTFSDWLNTLQHDETLTEIDPPAGLQATLRPYQRYGYSWLHFANRWRMGVILADDMGLGKTIQTLTMIQRLKEEASGRFDRPILLVCPTSVVTNWDLERQKFTPDLNAHVHQGADRLRGEALIEAIEQADMVLTSFALVRRDAETLGTVDWQGVILDEAQNIKNANTKQAQVIRRLSADFRLALTGTPVENRLSELWSIMQFLNPGFLGSQKAFRKTFTLPIEKDGDAAAADQLRKLTRPFILRRVKTDPTVISDLPEKQEMKVYCTLSAEQATLYEAVVQASLQAVEEESDEGIKRKGIVLSMLTQLKQICNHPVQYLHQSETYNPFEDHGRSGKLDRLSALLDEIFAGDDRILIFSQFTEMAGLLRETIQNRFGVETAYLHGGVKPKKRAELVDRFQNDPEGPPVFLLSLKAGGTGLNLTRANHVFHFDRWWNPAVENQATDRAFRIGQKKNVMVHKFVCTGTLEERIDQMIEEKKALAEQIVGSGEGWLTELSTADLKELVRLR
ncbi:MAG: DEAD/DEAH box helicase [Chloroflexota bacterium]